MEVISRNAVSGWHTLRELRAGTTHCSVLAGRRLSWHGAHRVVRGRTGTTVFVERPRPLKALTELIGKCADPITVLLVIPRAADADSHSSIIAGSGGSARGMPGGLLVAVGLVRQLSGDPHVGSMPVLRRSICDAMQSDPGRCVPAEQVFATIRARHADRPEEEGRVRPHNSLLIDGTLGL